MFFSKYNSSGFLRGGELSSKTLSWGPQLFPTNKIQKSWKYPPRLNENSGQLRCICVARFRCLHGAGRGVSPCPPRCRALEFFDTLHLGSFPRAKGFSVVKAFGLVAGRGGWRFGGLGVREGLWGPVLPGRERADLSLPDNSLRPIKLYREGLRGRREQPGGSP